MRSTPRKMQRSSAGCPPKIRAGDPRDGALVPGQPGVVRPASSMVVATISTTSASTTGLKCTTWACPPRVPPELDCAGCSPRPSTPTIQRRPAVRRSAREGRERIVKGPAGLLYFAPPARIGFKVGRLVLAGDQVDFNLLETGGLEPAVQVALGKAEPRVAIEIVRGREMMRRQVQNHNPAAGLKYL